MKKVTLRTRIEEEHRAAIGDAISAIEHAIECGRLLLEAKDQCEWGKWPQWVAENLSFGERQARKYMQLAKNAGTLREEIRNRDSEFEGTLAQALKYLRTPQTVEGPEQLALPMAELMAPTRVMAPVIERHISPPEPTTAPAVARHEKRTTVAAESFVSDVNVQLGRTAIEKLVIGASLARQANLPEHLQQRLHELIAEIHEFLEATRSENVVQLKSCRG